MVTSGLKALRTPTIAIAIGAFVSGFTGGLGAFVVQRFIFPAPNLAVVDLPSIVGKHVSEPAVTSMADEERSRHAARFAHRLDAEITRLAHDYNALLLAAPVVIAGAPDLTPVLRARIEGLGDGADDRR